MKIKKITEIEFDGQAVIFRRKGGDVTMDIAELERDLAFRDMQRRHADNYIRMVRPELIYTDHTAPGVIPIILTGVESKQVKIAE